MCYSEDRIMNSVESFTANLLDSQFAPIYHYCKTCDELVHEDKVVETKCLRGIYFCDEDCRDKWEDENGWDYN